MKLLCLPLEEKELAAFKSKTVEQTGIRVLQTEGPAV